MKHLDLFSGYGGFTIPAQKYGIETIGFSEIDKYACSVLNYHYPNIKNYGDITKIKTEDLPTVDIITGGSPCQDLSVAGKGAGLNGERSGLFFYFIRLIKEKQPTYFVWENVKGALSSQGGWDFARVQIEMEQAGYDVYWQVLNAKDFGVPQNRERIFAIGVRKGSGREILFEQGESGQDTIKNIGNVYPSGGENGQVLDPSGISKAIKSGETNTKGNGGIGSSNSPKIIVQTGHDGTNIYGTDGIATTQKALGGGQGAKTGLYAVPNKSRRSQVIVHNLQPRSPNRPSLLKNKNAGGSGHLQREDGITYTVDTGCTQGIEIIGSTQKHSAKMENISPSLTKAMGDGGGHIPMKIENMRIRRLTPTECERLMGLEDNWTAKGIIDGKEVNISDTQRYKMCGNGVVVNCVDYIYNLITKAL